MAGICKGFFTIMIHLMFILFASNLSEPVVPTDHITCVLLVGTGKNEIAPHGEGNAYAPSILQHGRNSREPNRKRLRPGAVMRA